MKTQFFLMFIAPRSEARSDICREKVCKFCDVFLSADRMMPTRSEMKVGEMCDNLFSIENCCNRFFRSSNVLGPVVEPPTVQYRELSVSHWIALIATVAITMAVLMSALLTIGIPRD